MPSNTISGLQEEYEFQVIDQVDSPDQLGFMKQPELRRIGRQSSICLQMQQYDMTHLDALSKLGAHTNSENSTARLASKAATKCRIVNRSYLVHMQPKDASAIARETVQKKRSGSAASNVINKVTLTIFSLGNSTR